MFITSSSSSVEPGQAYVRTDEQTNDTYLGLATIFSDHRQFDALFVVLPVLAQSTEADTTARPKADSTTIVATSSRLASWGYKALSPVSVLDSAKFKLSGIQAIENTLNKSPQFTPDDYDSSDNGLNKGVAVVNMRQLGEKHSPLVNGHS